jgi:hypothetical protein
MRYSIFMKINLSKVLPSFFWCSWTKIMNGGNEALHETWINLFTKEVQRGSRRPLKISVTASYFLT